MTRGYARYVLGVMLAINFLNYMDRYVPAGASPLIQKEFHLDDTQVGLIGSAFLIVYALSAVPFGYWADRGVRKVVIGGRVPVWSFATLLPATAQNLATFVLTRSAVGIGEAAYFPAGTSLMSDYFPKHERGRVMSVWGIGSSVGVAGGFAGGGIIAEKLGWRNAFLFAAIPGLICALLAFTMREPLRGSVETVGTAVAKTYDASLGKFFELMRIPTLRATILSQTLHYFVLASNAFWLPILLTRRFGLTTGSAGILAGGVVLSAGLVGTLAGGWISDRLGRKNPAAYLQVGIVGFLVGAVFVVVALYAPLQAGPIPVFIPVFFVAVVCMYLYSGSFTAISQAVVSPALRASSVTLLLLVSHVLGDSHSPFDVGFISASLGGNLQLALTITSPTLLIFAAIVAATGLRTARPDIEAMEDEWAKRTAPISDPVVPAASRI